MAKQPKEPKPPKPPKGQSPDVRFCYRCERETDGFVCSTESTFVVGGKMTKVSGPAWLCGRCATPHYVDGYDPVAKAING